MIGFLEMSVGTILVEGKTHLVLAREPGERRSVIAHVARERALRWMKEGGALQIEISRLDELGRVHPLANPQEIELVKLGLKDELPQLLLDLRRLEANDDGPGYPGP